MTATCMPSGRINRFSQRRTGRADPQTGEEKLAQIRPAQGGFRDDPFAPLVYALEEFDPVGQRAAKADIFSRRVIAPRAPRLGADTPADALAISLDTCGAGPAGRDRPAARHQRGRRPRPARHAGLRRPGVRHPDPGRRVPVRPGPRQTRPGPGGRRGRPAVRRQRRRAPHGAPGGSDAGRDRRAPGRGLDRRPLCPAVPARAARRPQHPGRASRRAGLGGERRPAQRPGHLNLGHRPLPRAPAGPGHPRTARHHRPRHDPDRRRGTHRPQPGRDPGRPGESRGDGRAVLRMGLGRPRPRRRAGPHLQRPVQQPRAAQLRRHRLVACPAWP